MKKFRAAVIVFAVAAALYFHFKSSRPAPPHPADNSPPGRTGEVPANNSQAKAASATAQNATANPPDNSAARAASPAPAATVIPNLPPATVLDNARIAIHNYNAAFGENPVGTNPEITAALLGQNPKQINFITAESGLRVNDRGEMLDGWGTPLFFHQISGQEMEIRSAGEDRKLWTFDDLVAK